MPEKLRKRAASHPRRLFSSPVFGTYGGVRLFVTVNPSAGSPVITGTFVQPPNAFQPVAASKPTDGHTGGHKKHKHQYGDDPYPQRMTAFRSLALCVPGTAGRLRCPAGRIASPFFPGLCPGSSIVLAHIGICISHSLFPHSWAGAHPIILFSLPRPQSARHPHDGCKWKAPAARPRTLRLFPYHRGQQLLPGLHIH